MQWSHATIYFNLIEVKALSVWQFVIAATFQRSKNAIEIINTLALLSFNQTQETSFSLYI